jgi:hypothetical protein
MENVKPFPLECCRIRSKTSNRRRLMTHFELTQEEAGVLREVLESYLSDLRMEIGGTENMNFREMLKKKEVFLMEILRRLQTS